MVICGLSVSSWGLVQVVKGCDTVKGASSLSPDIDKNEGKNI